MISSPVVMLFGIAVRYIITSVLSAALLAIVGALLLVASQTPAASTTGTLYGNVPSIGPSTPGG